MSDSKQYKVNYVRGPDGEWTAQIVDPEGTSKEISGHSHRTAKVRVKKALAEALGSDEAAESAEIVEEIQLPQDLTASLASLRRKREMLEMLEEEVKQETLRLSRVLLSQYGISLRDVAKKVGLSFQRLAAMVGE